MNRRFEISIRVYYLSGLYDDETFPAQGINRAEAENKLLAWRDERPDSKYHSRVKVTGCVEIRDGVYAGGAA